MGSKKTSKTKRNAHFKSKDAVSANNNSNNSGNFKDEYLQAHNECRKKHNVPPATWSNTLAHEAQKWADAIAKKGKFEHAKPNQRKGQGENISAAGGQPLDGRKATMMWYDEIQDYDFKSKPTYNPNCGHFTQVVWAASTEIGAGRATDKKGMHYVVGRYSPAGNNLNLFEENIKPPVDTVDGDIESSHINEDLVIPINKKDEVFQSPHIEFEDKIELIKENPSPAMLTQNIHNGSLMIYEVKKVKEERNERELNYEHKTVEVTISTSPVKQAFYHSRSSYYLKHGKSYRVIQYEY